jgi:hypothetical protein
MKILYQQLGIFEHSNPRLSTGGTTGNFLKFKRSENCGKPFLSSKELLSINRNMF